MADDDHDEPSLELPSFGLGRRRARKDRFVEPDPLTAPLEEVEAHVEEEPAPVPATRPLFVEETAEAAPAAPAAAPAPAPAPVRGARRQARPSRTPRSAGGVVAVLATGLLVGALTVGLTWLGQRGCEAVRGTSSCGAPGLLLLLAILTAMVLLGAGALRLARVPDPGSTGFLAVGLLTVFALLFLVGSLFEWWVVIAVPLLSGLTFVLSHRVTTSFAGEDADA
ncbi:hypothetical protein [Nocardioides taihuensis]|uniref:Integral membrane protein n=1 Tax=Nocardioides taihuensis TaxID=1835606 RepID=A0ABW0BK35_9ACTN